MEIVLVLGILFFLFGLKVSALFWIYFILEIIGTSCYVWVQQQDDPNYKHKYNNTFNIYAFMLLLNSNYELFHSFGYTHHDTFFIMLAVISWGVLGIKLLLPFVYTIGKHFK